MSEYDRTAAERMARHRARQRGETVLKRRPGRPGTSPAWRRELPVFGLSEGAVWEGITRELHLDTDSPAGKIMGHAFTEMLNNAIEHSGSETVTISWWLSPDQIGFEVADSGVGVYAKLQDALGLDSPAEAVQELSKGKRTTDPARHSGEGIFFTSKMVDLFTLTSSDTRWTADNLQDDQALGNVKRVHGTRVRCQVSVHTDRIISDVFAEHTTPVLGDEEVRTFDRTHLTVKLFEKKGSFVSRSEARRLLQGLEGFQEIVVDFKGVMDVGQAFVDEVFRVWPSQHPAVMVRPVNMDHRAVRFMVLRGLRSTQG